MLNLPLSPDLSEAFSKAKGQSSLRSFKICIKNEQFALEATGNASSFSLDFNSFQKSLTNDECCFIAFRYKDTFQDRPWALIMYTPDTCPVKDKMMYASSFAACRDALGAKFFSKLKRYSSPSDFVWNDFQNSESDEIEGDSHEKKPVDNKPWNKRELAIQQLEREEADARREFEELALAKPVEASGYSQVSFPFTPELEEVVKNINNGQYNWVQLCIDDPPSKFELVLKKHVSPSELSGSVDPNNPQFYVYYFEDTVVLIYCCPETVTGGYSQTIKKRMVYSSSKASVAQTIKSLGHIKVKKFDTQEPGDLTQQNLVNHLRNKSASLFKGSDLKPAAQNFNPQRPSHKVAQQPQAGSLAGLMANTGAGKNTAGPGKKLPKGVVIPSSGAHC